MSDSAMVQGSYARSTRVGGVQLNIDVTVQCTPADLDTLRHKLRKVLQDFNEAIEPDKKSDTPTPPAPDPSVSRSAVGGGIPGGGGMWWLSVH
jgi:hypothetical protein